MKKRILVSVCVVLSLLLVRSHASPSRAIVDVSTVAQLQAAVGALTSGTTIRIAPGRYALTQELNINNVTNVALARTWSAGTQRSARPSRVAS